MDIQIDERRAVPRIALSGHATARTQTGLVVRLLHLSRHGVRIAHRGLLRPGSPCALALPPPYGALNLSAQVVWCTVVGRKRKLGGTSHLVARSGLRFTRLTGAQQAALADTLQDLATALQPIA
jgi:PilZ domain